MKDKTKELIALKLKKHLPKIIREGTTGSQLMFIEDLAEELTHHTVDKGVSDTDNSIEVCVVELSDNELQVWTKAELEKAYKDAEEFDGFIGWTERAKGVMQKKHIEHLFKRMV